MAKFRCKFVRIPTWFTNIIFIIFAFCASAGFVTLSWMNFKYNRPIREFYTKKMKEIDKKGGIIIESVIKPYKVVDLKVSNQLKEQHALSYLSSTFSEKNEEKNIFYYVNYIKKVLHLQDVPFGSHSRIKGIEIALEDLGLFGFANALLLTENQDDIYDQKLFFSLIFYGLNGILLLIIGGIYIKCNCVTSAFPLFTYYAEAGIITGIGVFLGPCLFENKRKVITFYSFLLTVKKLVLFLTFIYITVQFKNNEFDTDGLVEEDKKELINLYNEHKDENSLYGDYGILLLLISTAASFVVSFIWGYVGARMLILECECCKTKINPKNIEPKINTDIKKDNKDKKEIDENSEEGGWEEDWKPEKDEDEIDEILAN